MALMFRPDVGSETLGFLQALCAEDCVTLQRCLRFVFQASKDLGGIK